MPTQTLLVLVLCRLSHGREDERHMGVVLLVGGTPGC